MRKIISVYNRKFKSLNSSGPKDPCDTAYIVDGDDPFPAELVNAGAVRFIATEDGHITWKIQRLVWDNVPDRVLTELLKCGRPTSVSVITADLKESV